MFKEMKGEGHMARGDRATSRSQALWALEMGAGSHFQDAGRPCWEATAEVQVRDHCGLD